MPRRGPVSAFYFESQVVPNLEVSTSSLLKFSDRAGDLKTLACT